jgi:hypothetical protein
VPFRWGYNVLQAVGAIAGWLCGADIGPGTVAVVVAIGPAVGCATPDAAELGPPCGHHLTWTPRGCRAVQRLVTPPGAQ